MSPLTIPTARVRPRNHSASPGIPTRPASAVRNTPARNAHVVTARQPPTSEVGLTHELIRSPYPRAGTRPEAIAPATVPKKNGAISDDAAKIAPNNLAWLKVSAYLRNAKLAPRNTIPASASINGMNRVVVAAAKAAGKPGHQITLMEMSQTWMASHTRPMPWAASIRRSPARPPPPARQSYKPEPKPAPTNNAL